MSEHIKQVFDLDYTVVATPVPGVEDRLIHYVIYEGAEYNNGVPLIEGSVKWDGSSTWEFDLVGGCTRDDLLNIGKVLALCWDWTAELCPNWNPGDLG